MSGMLTRSKRKKETDALETRAEPDRVGLTSLEQVLLIWTIREKHKAHTKYSEMTAYWVQKNFQAFCYYKPKLIERIDTTLVLRLTIYMNKLFSGSSDGSICVWDADTHAHVATLQGHTDSVFCLTIYKNKLFSVSADRTIRVWDADTHAHMATLKKHTDNVTCSTIYKNKLFSGSADFTSTICVWDADTHVPVTTLQGHVHVLTCLTIYKNKLFSSSAGHTIRVWDADTHITGAHPPLHEHSQQIDNKLH